MKEIKDIKELHENLFNIAKAVDKVLSAHNIPFIIAYGSLLGAIRHNGFIPWDDDMDFYVPISKYKDAWKVLKEELPYPYEIVSYETNKACEALFYKVQNSRTVIYDKMSYACKEQKLGINIDLFPLLENIDGNDFQIKKFQRKFKLYRMIYGRDPQKRPLVMFVKKILQWVWPKSKVSMMKSLIDYSAKFKQGTDSYSYLANIDENEIIPMRYFGKLAKIKFENYEFTCPEDVDGYLSFYFGDYMVLPPKEKQKWHNEGVYEYD